MIRFVWVFIIICTPLVGKEGKLVVLYGTTYSGKSTLAEELKRTLPDDFNIIRRRERKTQLCMPCIPKTMQAVFDHPSIAEIEHRLADGENLIFDICLYKSEQLNKFDHLKPIFVLVYAPIPELSAREVQRSGEMQTTVFSQERCREFILNEFCQLYEPASPDKRYGSLTKSDVVDYYLKTRDKWFSDGYARSAQKVILEFRLKSDVPTPLAPRKRPTVFIDTSKMTPAESARLIKHWL